MKASRKIGCLFLSLLVLASLSVGLLFLNKSSVSGFTGSDTNFVKVGEIWNSNNSTFNLSNLNLLLQYVCADPLASIENIQVVQNKAKAKLTASEMYASSVTTSNGTKAASKNIIVTLSGLDWTPTYLSTTKNDEIILTLWLSNSNQLSGGRYGSDKTFDADGKTTWSGKVSGTSTGSYLSNASTEKYPSNMYGTSYLHSVVLNNGGAYATSSTATTNYTKNSDSIFAPFTMPVTGEYNDLTDFITKPVDVGWQEVQSKITDSSGGSEYSVSNEGWSQNIPNTGTYQNKSFNFFDNPTWGVQNYAGKTGNDAWKNATLWIPSLTETGWHDSSSSSGVGIWKTTKSQRTNIVITAIRSAYYMFPSYVYNIEATGDSYYNITPYTSDEYGVRPALHLNISKILKSYNYSDYIYNESAFVKVDELWDSSNNQVNSQNYKKLLRYISGDGTSPFLKVIETINSQAASKRTATQMRASTALGKSANQDIVVKLGGLYWTPTYLSKVSNGHAILTLWLQNSLQLAGKPYGDTVFGPSGMATFSSGWSSPATYNYPTSMFPSNMYGSSYLNNVVLNYGYRYVSSNTEFVNCSASRTSVFAQYTTTDPDDNYTNYDNLYECIVTPYNVSWQTTQYAKSYGSPYNMPNEAWSIVSDSGFYSSAYNYCQIEGNMYWSGAHLWLPSWTEISSNGIWKTSVNQRANPTETWLRSGAIGQADTAAAISASGTSLSSNYNVAELHGIRPAMHLDLTAFNSIMQYSWDDYAADSYAGGDGTALAPYIIKTPEQLGLLSHQSLTGLTQDLYYELGADIDLDGYEWSGIGRKLGEGKSSFMNSKFNGKFYTISNLTISNTNESYFGLFNYITHSTISNIILRDMLIHVPSRVTIVAGGGLIGEVNDTSTISNIFIIGGYMSIVSTKSNTGSLAGRCVMSDIKNVFVTNFNGTGAYMCPSGIVGDLNQGFVTSCVVKDCSLGHHAGGIVGNNQGTVQDCAVINVTNGNYGTIGSSSAGVIKSSYADMNTNYLSPSTDDWSNWTYSPSIFGGYPVPKPLFYIGGFGGPTSDTYSGNVYNYLKAKLGL